MQWHVPSWWWWLSLAHALAATRRSPTSSEGAAGRPRVPRLGARVAAASCSRIAHCSGHAQASPRGARAAAARWDGLFMWEAVVHAPTKVFKHVPARLHPIYHW